MDSKKYLAKWFDEIGFLEQRKDGSHILGGIPIPMLQRDIIEEIKHPGESGRLHVEHIFIAMCAIIGLDDHFPYAQDYLRVLNENKEDAIDFINYKMAKAAEDEDEELLFLLAKTKERMRGNIEDRLATIYGMEEVYNRYWRENEGKDCEDLLKEIMDRYEKIIEENAECVEAHASLGRIHQASENYIKAKFYYEKALQLTEDAVLKDRLRESIETVEEPAAIDGAKTYLHYGKYEEALSTISGVKSQYNDPAACAYIKGMAYYGLGKYPEAVKHLYEASDYTKEAKVHNDLAIALAAEGNETRAIAILKNIVDIHPQERTSWLNLGILLYREANYPEALEAFETAYRLQSDESLWELMEQARKLSLSKN